jgi:hypothetical protein
MRRLLLIGAAAAGAAAVAFYYKVRPWWKGWGVEPAEADLALAGDDIVAEPTVVETRGITIDAPPSAIWPWLVQMGYDRGGWYSYDQMDMKGKSADTIVPEWQKLEVGDTMPTFPGGGFAVKVVEPEKALVLHLDNGMVEGWRRAQGEDLETPTRGLAFAGAMGERSMPGAFSVSWAFALRPTHDGQTRLIERFRASIETETPGSRFAGPFMGFGLFVMMQRQMVGIKERAERLARQQGIAPIVSEAAAEPDVEAAPAVGEPVMAEEAAVATEETPA